MGYARRHHCKVYCKVTRIASAQMNRSIRIGLFALLLLAVVGGSAWAAAGPHSNKTPSFADASEAPESPPSADELARVVDKLAAQGITTDAEELAALAAKYGMGGAIRLVAWADATGKTVVELSTMRDDGQGWGQMAHELGLSPGIGWIMGNGHAGDHGKANAPGQQKDKAKDADESESPDADDSPEESQAD